MGDSLEYKFAEENDARNLLPFVLDRVRLTPSKPFLSLIAQTPKAGQHANTRLYFIFLYYRTVDGLKYY